MGNIAFTKYEKRDEAVGLFHHETNIVITLKRVFYAGNRYWYNVLTGTYVLSSVIAADS